jgi:hypothetical protein
MRKQISAPANTSANQNTRRATMPISAKTKRQNLKLRLAGRIRAFDPGPKHRGEKRPDDDKSQRDGSGYQSPVEPGHFAPLCSARKP